MTEFKINQDCLAAEVDNVCGSNDAVNGGYAELSDHDLCTLRTALKTLEQHKKIKLMLTLYQELVDRDCQDLKNMIQEIIEMDENISGNLHQ